MASEESTWQLLQSLQMCLLFQRTGQTDAEPMGSRSRTLPGSSKKYAQGGVGLRSLSAASHWGFTVGFEGAAYFYFPKVGLISFEIKKKLITPQP